MVEIPKMAIPPAETPKAAVDEPAAGIPKIQIPRVSIPKIEAPKPEPPKAASPKPEVSKPQVSRPVATSVEPSGASVTKTESNKTKAEAALRASLKAIGSAGSSSSSGTVLGIAWINGEFSAVATNRNSKSGSWINPEAVNDTSAFGTALRMAAAQSGFTGNQVSLVLAHPRLTHRFIEVPQQKSAQSQKALERQVDQGKAFQGPARWVTQETLPTKTSGGAIVHVAPVELVHELVTAAERAGFVLSCIIPVTEAIRGLVKATGSGKDDTVLIATALPTSTQLVLADGKGTPLLVRSVSESWQKDPGRVVLDLNRTQQFVQQQFERRVSAVWLHGPDAVAKSLEMAPQLQIPVRTFPQEHDPLFFASAAAQAAGGNELNLVSREQTQAPQRRVMVKFSLILATILLLAAGGVAGYVQVMQRQSKAMLARLKKDEETLKARFAALQASHDKLARHETFLKVIGDNRQSPAHIWFLGYLSESLPMELLVTNVTARVQTNRWHFVIHGQAQPALVQRGDRSFPTAFGKFTNALATGPIPLQLHSGVPTVPAAAGSAGAPADWASRLKLAPSAPVASANLNFTLEGVLP